MANESNTHPGTPSTGTEKFQAVLGDGGVLTTSTSNRWLEDVDDSGKRQGQRSK